MGLDLIELGVVLQLWRMSAFGLTLGLAVESKLWAAQTFSNSFTLLVLLLVLVSCVDSYDCSYGFAVDTNAT